MFKVMYSGFEKEDRIQAAMLYFGMWLEENNVRLSQRVPMSLINTKYGKKIRESLQLSPYANLETIGKYVLDMGLVVLDTFEPTEKFTEKNQRVIDKLIPKDLPIGSKLTLREDEPNELNVSINIPFEDLLMSNLTVDGLEDLKNIPKIFIGNMKKFLGIDEGNRLHGDFEIYKGHNFVDLDKWEKKFAKQIKPDIKKLPGGENIRAIKLQINHRERIPMRITLYFHSRRNDYQKEVEIRDRVVKMLQDKYGYNTDLISIKI